MPVGAARRGAAAGAGVACGRRREGGVVGVRVGFRPTVSINDTARTKINWIDGQGSLAGRR